MRASGRQEATAGSCRIECGLMATCRLDGVARSEIVEAAGLRIRARLSGSGRPLLLINGIGCNLETWAPLESVLHGFQLLTFDPPGIGASQAPRWPMRLSGYSTVIAALADHFEWQEFDVFGFSWGGTLAQQFAHNHPQRVRRLILCATTFGLGGYSVNPLVLGMMSNPFRHSSAWVAHAVAPVLYGDDVREHPAGYAAFIQAKSPPSLRAYYAQVYALTGWSSLPWLHRLRMPTLVMAGTQDQVIPRRNAGVIARRIPRARLKMVTGGHLFPLLRSPECARAIRDFLSAQDVEPPTATTA